MLQNDQEDTKGQDRAYGDEGVKCDDVAARWAAFGHRFEIKLFRLSPPLTRMRVKVKACPKVWADPAAVVVASR